MDDLMGTQPGGCRAAHETFCEFSLCDLIIESLLTLQVMPGLNDDGNIKPFLYHITILEREEISSNTETCQLKGECQWRKLFLFFLVFVHANFGPLPAMLDNGWCGYCVYPAEGILQFIKL